MFNTKLIAWLIIIILYLNLLWSCASLRNKDLSRPETQEEEIPYPLTIKTDESRRNQAIAEWEVMTKDQGITNAPHPILNPATNTIAALPTMSEFLYLPKVGVEAKMAEEETLEALRRFISNRSRLFGADPQQLSLVLKQEQGNKTKVRYQQRAFPYPLRGNYGLLELDFDSDRRILSLSSTNLPDTERLRRSIIELKPQLRPDEVIDFVANRVFKFINSKGEEETISFGPKENLRLEELVIYPVPSLRDRSILEIHLAWELVLNKNIAEKRYLDAVTNGILFPPEAEID
jgi:hypothetical protein